MTMTIQSSNAVFSQCPAQSVGPLDSLVSTLVQALLVAQCNLSKPDFWPPDYAEAALQPGGLDGFDYVVIGAGSAGSVVASRLSEDPKTKVLVLEAGGDPPQEVEVPGMFFSLQHTNATWNYYTEPTGRTSLANINHSVYWPRGRTIGGSGSINGMAYVRGNRKDYDGWLQKGNPGWGWDDVLPFFEKSLRRDVNVSQPQGYLTINATERYDVDIEDMIFAGAEELGFPRVKRFDEGTETGYTFLPGSVANGQRTSSGKGFLGAISDRPNLHVIKNAQATRINFDSTGKTAESVSFVLGSQQELQVEVKQELVLSAGTIDSAKLLMLSGVGPRQHLDSLGIPVKHDLPVGRNLQDHVVVPIYFQLGTNKVDPITERDYLDSIYNYLMHRRGPFASNMIALTAFINTVKGSLSPYPDIEYHYLIVKRGDFSSMRTYNKANSLSEEFGQLLLDLLRHSDIIAVLTILAHPKSIGKLELRSTNYEDAPKIFANYLEHPEDSQTILRAIRHLMDLEGTKAFLSKEAQLAHIPIDECDHYTFKSDSYWLCYMKYFTLTLYHHTGTVKMGPATDNASCVSPRLRLHGVENLRVADASIMPDVPSCNTNAAAIMVGEKAADMIKEDRKSSMSEN